MDRCINIEFDLGNTAFGNTVTSKIVIKLISSLPFYFTLATYEIKKNSNCLRDRNCEIESCGLEDSKIAFKRSLVSSGERE